MTVALAIIQLVVAIAAVIVAGLLLKEVTKSKR